MKLLNLAFKRETAMPVLALSCASIACGALVIARVIWTREIHYAFLIWNLFLAWLPLVFALYASEKHQTESARSWRFLALTAAWLLFFPNAPYIFTDLIHVSSGYYAHFWVDMVLILSCAFTGLVVGFVSLYLMQAVVTRIVGRLASWLFIMAVSALSGFGICLGRFVRLNSWDILFKPGKLYHGIGSLAGHPFTHSTSLALPMLFAAFLFIAYVTLYGLTHLKIETPQPA
jgi:uncharacterized membrane protein